MTTWKDLLPLLPKLSPEKVRELYGVLLPRAMGINPMRPWDMKLNPTWQDLVELVKIVPPDDAEDIFDLYV